MPLLRPAAGVIKQHKPNLFDIPWGEGGGGGGGEGWSDYVNPRNPETH